MTQRKALVLVIAGVLAFAGLLVALFALNPSTEQRRVTGGGPQAPGDVKPLGPGEVVSTPGGDTYDGRIFTVPLPKDATDVTREGSGDSETVSFRSGRERVSISTQPMLSGTDLDINALSYGAAAKRTRVGGRPAYIVESRVGKTNAALLITEHDGRLVYVDVIGPDASDASSLSRRLRGRMTIADYITAKLEAQR